MSRPVYSRRFIAHAGLSGRGASVVVPPGHTYVVKQVTIYATPLLGLTSAFFEDDTSGAALFAQRFTLNGGGWSGMFGTLVFEAGEGFHFQVNNPLGEAADVSCHGFDLTAT